jgi:DNA polymerase V
MMTPLPESSIGVGGINMNAIALSGDSSYKTQPLQGTILWSDDLELAVLALSKPLTVLDLPLFAFKVPAGFPSPADDHLEATIDLNQHCITNPPATFLVRVKGHSMIHAGIYDNDLLIVDRSLQAKQGSIVVAVVDGEVTVKALDTTNNEIWLRAKNPDYPDLQIKEGMDFQIWGVVKNGIRSLLV